MGEEMSVGLALSRAIRCVLESKGNKHNNGRLP